MFLITDSHVNIHNAADFFSMLDAVANTSQDVIFLGDIFDLWIALPRYEQDIHHRFLNWCRQQKKHRTIGFVEGNHEFFLTEQHPDSFTWCHTSSWLDQNGNLFIHGDLVNHHDTNYFRFRKITKGPFIKALLRHLPLGPSIAQAVKRRLKKRNNQFRSYLPETIIHNYANRTLNGPTHAILAGHFHLHYTYKTPDNRPLHLIPDWQNTGNLAHYNQTDQTLTIQHWTKL